MKALHRAVFLASLLLLLGYPLASSAETGSSQLKTELASAFTNTIAGRIPLSQIGFVAIDAKSGEEFISVNGAKPMMPASVLKLVPTYAALKLLGADYRFPTEVFVKGQDLYIRGHGDPSFTSESLWKITQTLYGLGIRKLQNVIVDDTLFISPRGRLGSNPYQAAESALSLNYNCYEYIAATDPVSGQAAASLTLGSPFKLENNLRVVNGSVSNVAVSDLVGGRVTVTGTVGRDALPIIDFQTVEEPSRNFAEVFKTLLLKSGIEISGAVTLGAVNKDARLVYTAYSRDLAVILRDLNHYSSNFIGNQLLFALGRTEDGHYDKALGISRVAAVLAELGIVPGSYKMVDGCGLDRENAFSAGQLAQVLSQGYSDFSIAPEFLASLSRYGASGTLKKRRLVAGGEPVGMKSPDGGSANDLGVKHTSWSRREAVWGKTGSINGVSSLAGYITLRNNTRLAFVIIINGPIGRDSAIALEDRLVEVILSLKSSS